MLYHRYLKGLKTCPFCQSKERVLASKKHAYLTYAKAPYHKHHLLVVPKKHVVSLFAISRVEARDIDELIKLGTKILQKLEYNNFTILVREGDNSNKSIKHVHYHLIPSDPIGDLNNKGKHRVVLTDRAIKKLVDEVSALAASLS